MTRLIAAISLLAFLAACGGLRQSSSNPFNWFGRDKEEVILAVGDEFADPRALVAQVVSVKVDRLPGGAIINTVGLPVSQGHYDGELVPLNGEFPDKGVLVYEFRLMNPPYQNPIGNKRSREVLVGHFVSDQTLIGVRRIQVIARENRRTVRR